jgi:hypothetical protein
MQNVGEDTHDELVAIKSTAQGNGEPSSAEHYLLVRGFEHYELSESYEVFTKTRAMVKLKITFL